MSIVNLPLEEKMNLAYSSSDVQTLESLARDASVSVRRLTAKNHNATPAILEMLSYDPVQNVSYVACKNPKSMVQREFGEILHPCVVCTNDERTLHCTNCKQLKSF